MRRSQLLWHSLKTPEKSIVAVGPDRRGLVGDLLAKLTADLGEQRPGRAFAAPLLCVEAGLAQRLPGDPVLCAAVSPGD